VPPFSPDIVPIRLNQSDKYILTVIVDPDYARRPVMLTQGNKVLVRPEGNNKAADWYRLRELFAEQQVSSPGVGLPPSANFIPGAGTHPDLGIRGRLMLSGPRGLSRHLTEPARSGILKSLNRQDAPITGTQSTLAALMHTWVRGSWGADSWQLQGFASAKVMNAQWHGIAPGGQRLTEARLNIQLTPIQARGDDLIITLDALLTNPRRAIGGDQLKAQLGSPDDRDISYLQELPPTPFIHLDGLRRLMLDTLATLWGPLGTQASTGILSQPLGAPAQLDLAVFTVAETTPSQIPLDKCVDFGMARLIPGNTARPWTDLDAIQPDHHLLNRPEQERIALDWLLWLGLNNGYQHIEQELARHTYK
jgi:hypothetical protein